MATTNTARTVKSEATGSRASTQGAPATDTPKPEGDAPAPDTAIETAMKEQDAKEEDGGVPGETREAKFTRLGKARVQRAITAIQSIGKLSSANYTSTDEQRTKMFGALDAALADMKASFKPAAKDKPTFDF